MKNELTKIDNIIEVKNLHKAFKSYERGEGFYEAVKALFKRKIKIFKAVNGISFNIKKAEVVGFLGPNGAGKSTTLKMLTGIMHPDTGIVKSLGYIPWQDRKKYVKNIGAVFGQKTQLFWDLPAIDAFDLHKHIYKLDDATYRRQLKRLTTLLDIEDIMKRPVRQLSLGQRMRCEFIVAMLHNPEIVFLDEPTIGLDVIAKEIIRSFITQINKEEKTTFIITSHDLEDIEHLCHRVIVINKGEIVFDDKMSKLKTGNKKYVTVTFADKVARKQLSSIKGVKVRKFVSEFAVKLEINTRSISLDMLIKELKKLSEVRDLEVANPPIKEVIKKLFGEK